MATKKFGYVRVSTREQNPERQIHILRDEEGIDERDIYVEKESPAPLYPLSLPSQAAFQNSSLRTPIPLRSLRMI